jgi:hypothetical protein
MPSYHVVRRQGFYSDILVIHDPLDELSLAGWKVMAIVAVDNLQIHCLLANGMTVPLQKGSRTRDIPRIWDAGWLAAFTLIAPASYH